MKKYWIIENGRPVGPFTQAELKSRADFRADMPVWFKDLPDWTTVGQLAELSCLLPETDTAEEQKKTEVTVNSEEEPQQQNPFNFTMGGAQSQWINTASAARRMQPEDINGIKKPNAYVGWNIFILLCCCIPTGVVGIIFGTQVNRCWFRGDIRGAQKASEIAQWCIILGIVLSLVAWPFQFLFTMI